MDGWFRRLRVVVYRSWEETGVTRGLPTVTNTPEREGFRSGFRETVLGRRDLHFGTHHVRRQVNTWSGRGTDTGLFYFSGVRVKTGRSECFGDGGRNGHGLRCHQSRHNKKIYSKESLVPGSVVY